MHCRGGGRAERTGRSLMASPHVPHLDFCIWGLLFDLWLSSKKNKIENLSKIIIAFYTDYWAKGR